MSIFDHPDSVQAAPSWRCPHCRTLQAETSRCWRCAQAAVTCSSCHLFRASVAGDLGYCAADRTRAPLSGDEVCPCWEAEPAHAPAAGLFDELVTPVAPALQSAPVRRIRSHPAPEPIRAPRPPVEEVRAAAWSEVPAGQLVEAPHVEPGLEVTSEIQRRTRGRWRR